MFLFLVYLGAILGGFGGSWTGPVIPKLRDLDQSPLPYLLTEAQLALVGSFGYLGAIPGLCNIGSRTEKKNSEDIMRRRVVKGSGFSH